MMSFMNSFQVYMQWWRTWKTLPVCSWIKAARLYRAGQYAQAEQLYRRGLKRFSQHPANCSARLDLAYCLFKQRKVVDSERELRTIITDFPNYREGYVRLARVQLWVGRCADAALTLRRALQFFSTDAEINALLLLCLIDQKASRYLIGEAITGVKRARELAPEHKLLKIAEARCVYFLGEQQRGKLMLSELALEDPALFDAVLAYAEVLVEEKNYEEGLRHLRRALQVSPNHPRVLSMMAHIYLTDSALFNPEFSQQIAISACQNTSWSSVRDLAILAQSYRAQGDKMAALVAANKARSLGGQGYVAHQEARTLDRLIDSLTTELQAA